MTDKDTLLFGKYQLIRILGHGRSGTVYLAYHQEMEEYRAIKRVPKPPDGGKRFRQEALLLGRLRHPGIPIVYDLEEDAHYSYLIEEYLEGDSFYDLVSKRGSLNQDAVIRYGIQICELVQYLHSAEENPILYLDLQPKNLLVCHGQVKLLDFDCSDTLPDANAASRRCGTPGFCAPEQQAGGQLGTFTDVYQIGAVLYYLAAGTPWEKGAAFVSLGSPGPVIRRCLRAEASERYGSVREIGEELHELLSAAEYMGPSQESPLIIALAGIRPGSGVTHISVGLSAYLNREGYPALYEEHNSSGDVRAMAELLGAEPDSYGICSLKGIPMKPRYGPAARFRAHGYANIVRDYGTELCRAEADWEAGRVSALVLILGGKWWESHMERAGRGHIAAAERLAADRRVVFLFNHSLPGGIAGYVQKGKRAEDGGKRFPAPDLHALKMRTPEFPDPFRPDRAGESFFGAFLRRSGIRPEAGKKERKLWDFFLGKRAGSAENRRSSE